MRLKRVDSNVEKLCNVNEWFHDKIFKIFRYSDSYNQIHAHNTKNDCEEIHVLRRQENDRPSMMSFT